MIIKWILYQVLLFILVTATINAQNPQDKPFAEVAKLSYLVGDWEGEGWIMAGQSKQEFLQKEQIRSKAGGRILVIAGMGYSKDQPSDDATVHDAFGIISFNPETQSLSMLAYSAARGKQQAEVVITGEKTFYWHFKDPQGGTIRFSQDFSHENAWHEVGEYSPDGEQWFKFLEMNLILVDK